MNKIVYVCSPTGRRVVGKGFVTPPHQTPLSGRWESIERVSKEQHADAKRKLREHYDTKAGMLGMTLAGYCARFGVKL